MQVDVQPPITYISKHSIEAAEQELAEKDQTAGPPHGDSQSDKSPSSYRRWFSLHGPSPFRIWYAL